MEKTHLSRWTRSGILDFSWSPFESFDKLVLNPNLRDKLTKRIDMFLRGEQDFHALKLPWRYGIFFFGPSGSGKTAAGRGIAQALGWQHFTIPAHEILDAHLFERALFDAVKKSHRVIVLEDIDQIVRSMEPEVFFTLLDHALERAEGSFWVANSRHAEEAPKIQLLRPGRFDESIRLEIPSSNMRGELLKRLLPIQEEEWTEVLSTEWLERTERLSFSHFEEMRQVIARLKLEMKEPTEVLSEVITYIDDQMIAGDRWGGLSDSTALVQERVKQMDARVLMAALDMTDVFKKLMEKVIGDAAEQSSSKMSENGDSG